MLDCWKITICSPHALRQCIFPACEGREPWNNLPKAASPGPLSPKKPCVCCAVLESGCVEWLGGVRHGICHTVILYSKSPSMPMYASLRQDRAESRNTCCLSHALAELWGDTKHSPGLTLVKVPSRKCRAASYRRDGSNSVVVQKVQGTQRADPKYRLTGSLIAWGEIAMSQAWSHQLCSATLKSASRVIPSEG